MKNFDNFANNLDVLDSEGNFTGKIKRWVDIHNDGDWHGAVHVWIFNNKKQILIRKRPSWKIINRGKWDIGCGGHIFVGDNGIDTAIKKALSELGIELQEKNLKFLFTVKDQHTYSIKDPSFSSGKYIENEIFNVYLFNMNGDKDSLNIKKEFEEEFKFIDISELKEHFLNKNPNFIIRQGEFKKIFSFLE